MDSTLTLNEAAAGIKTPVDFAKALDKLSEKGVFIALDGEIYADIPQKIALQQSEHEAEAFAIYMKELSYIPKTSDDALNRAFNTCTDDERSSLAERALRIVPGICELYAEPMNVDVLQAGNMGLLEAASDYKPDIHGVDFTLYAAFRIRHEVLQLIKAHVRHHEIGKNVREQSEQASKYYLKLKAEYGKAPNAEELSRVSGIDESICADVIKQLNN